ncbi:thiamine-phosphate kinase [Neisseria wadsworthii]|uniref:thiamine-phosphate kinase n=1 Tax=Neisseria wadsworthii TaxID=607711 RepID=UPI000D302770|nr:thiamine-phosphate kinase [Neisseria wadsworthii]
MTEFEFIYNFLVRQHDDDVLLGIGDDATIVRPRAGYDLCFSSDMLISGKHFFSDAAPEDIAHKVLAVNVSDMAAMGATPRWVLLSVAFPELDMLWLNKFCGTLFEQLSQYGISLIGGDTTKGNLTFNITIVGELPQGQALKRSGAKLGDDVWISGQVGMAAAALDGYLGKVVFPEAVWQACRQKYLRPVPRVALGQELLSLAHAAQDVSDGLAQDLGHILKASGVGAELWADRVPILPALRDCALVEQIRAWQLSGGDDYELLFTAPEAARAQILAAGEASGTQLSRIGKIIEGTKLHILDDAGGEIHLHKTGFDHFG